MKRTISKTILAFCIAFAMISTPVNATPVTNEEAVGAAAVIAIGGWILTTLFGGGEEAEYEDTEQNDVQYSRDDEQKREEARQAQLADEANRQQQNCITGCAW
ncbi:MAG: hypothetical protein ACXWT1_04115 [Methylobacter sp.]